MAAVGGLGRRRGVDGDEAIMAILEHRPDLVVCDVHMPGRSGPEVTRWIRQTPDVAAIPVVQVSARMDAEFLEDPRLEDGADAFLAMPVERQRFLATVRSLPVRQPSASEPTARPTAPAAPGAHPARVGRRVRLGIKIGAVVASVTVCALAVGLAGWSGIRSVASSNDNLYDHEFQTALILNNLSIHFVEAEALAFALISTDNASARSELFAKLNNDLIPHIEGDLAKLRSVGASDPSLLPQSDVGRLTDAWRGFTAFLFSPDFLRLRDEQGGSGRTELAAATEQQFQGVGAIAEALAQRANEKAAQEHTLGQQTADRTVVRLAQIIAATLLVAGFLGYRLHRDVVRRTTRYAEFASSVAAGAPSGPLTPTGRDEITDLGNALNELVEQQSRAQLAHQRRMAFSSALQLVAEEDEAHSLLQRYLERLVPDSAAFVLVRNNSADRLEVRTPLPQPSALGDRVAGATPRSCRAVRAGRLHDEEAGDAGLMSCELCNDVSGASTCVPLLVGGEVIGSVLTCTPSPIPPGVKESIEVTVTEAAPVIANLRNMAVAEHRATVDALTGLATRRSVQEALPRFLAHASRKAEPLTVLMLDLDHFKAVNDTYGHETGDHLLAAVGAAISGSIRAADLAGRFGGEEFVVLLPDTPAESGALAAEKIRGAIAQIRIPDGPPQVTASVGVAGFPDDAVDPTGLLRMADRALYQAKRAGRNQVVRSMTTHALAPSELGGPDPPEGRPR